MTINEQLHNSATHRKVHDQSCPVCIRRAIRKGDFITVRIHGATSAIVDHVERFFGREHLNLATIRLIDGPNMGETFERNVTELEELAHLPNPRENQPVGGGDLEGLWGWMREGIRPPGSPVTRRAR